MFEVGASLKKVVDRKYEGKVVKKTYQEGWTVAGYDHWWGVNTTPSPLYVHESGLTTDNGDFELIT